MRVPGRPRPPRSSVAAWIVYDLANTIFSFNIISFYYPLWLSRDLGLRDSVYALGASLSMAIVLLWAPTLGALSDRSRRRIPFLVASTVACVLPTFFLGWVEWHWSLLLFVAANIGFQAGLVFYDALLPYVSTPATRGRVGALGVGVGYVGSFVGLGVGRWILGADESRDATVFAATAVLFLLLALPAFFLVRDRAPARAAPFSLAVVAQSVRASWTGLLRLVRGRDVPFAGRFLLGRALYADAANTMILFMGVYAIHEVGYSDAQAAILLAVGIAGAGLLSPLWGILADRAGPKHALDAVLLTWMFGLLMVALVPVLALPAATFYPIAFILGGALGGTWGADRALLLGLAPAARVGEFYGYYAMVGRFAAILGPLLWALVVDGFGWGRPAAVFTILLFMVLSFALLRRVPDPLRANENRLGHYLPWRDGAGNPAPLPRRWALRAPATTVYALVTTLVYLWFRAAYGADARQVPEWLFRLFVYQIPELTTNVPLTLLHFVTGIWINWHHVQLIYVLILLGLFGYWVEVREGTRRAALVFYGTSIFSGVFAGLLLHALRATTDWAWVDDAWTKGWTGGSAGAFGLMGYAAARARRPWLLLLCFTFWEVNVEAWHLRSYTPAFHFTAMTAGYLVARHGWAPRGAPPGADSGPARTKPPSPPAPIGPQAARGAPSGHGRRGARAPPRA